MYELFTKNKTLVLNYSLNEEILQIIGKDAKSVCDTTIKEKLIDNLDEAFFLGKRTQEAEIAIKDNKTYKFGRIINKKIKKKILAEPNRLKELDSSGYFEIFIESPNIHVQHYDNVETKGRIRSGQIHEKGLISDRNIDTIWKRIIGANFISRKDHACYMGRELTKAKYALKMGIEYVQDGA